MTRETRIGLLIGLGFVVVFGLVLSELTTPESPAPASEQIGSAYRHTYVIDETPGASGGRTIRISRSGSAAEAHSGRSGTASPARRSSAPAAHAAQVRRASGDRMARYAVQQGDTLIGIARKVYGPGHERQYRRIFQANQQVLSDEGTVRPGQVLVIPSLRYNRPAPGRPAGPDFGQISRAAAQTAQPQRHNQANSRDLPRPIAAAITRGPDKRVHVVKRGQTLPEIAYIFYRDDSHRSVMKIYDANEEKLQGLDHLPAGMVLTISR
ncbi:MAG: LysM peptidoglycan-binding domain-containing protein [Phycisphaerae bacterium]|nr:LysM peptidoglycan-binding domain-containing protein [Phycisphaerae bacterium]